MAEVFEYELRGKDTSFGNTVKNAVKAVGELKSAGAQVISSFTGGLIGGGIAQSVLSTVQLIRDLIRDARQLTVDAERLGASRNTTRGIKNLETALDLTPGTMSGVAGAVENAVQEAMQGSAEMQQQFRALGMDPKTLDGLNKVEQMFRVLEAFRAAGSAPEQRFAARRIMGAGAEELEPYALGGKAQLDFRSAVRELRLLSDDPRLRYLEGNSAYVAAISPETRAAYNRFEALRDVGGRSEMRADLGGYSAFGLENAKRLKQMEEAVQEARDRNNRAGMTAEQQLLDIAEKRLKKQRELEGVRDPMQRLRMEMDIEQLRAAGIAVKSGMSRAGIPGISRDLDQMARAGFFRGGAPDIATDTMRKQLAEMQRIAAILKALPPEIARTL